MNKFLQFFTAMLFLIITTATFADNANSKRESDLYESLLDLEARFDNEISYNELRSNLSELNIKFDRYTRNGGDSYGKLYDAIKAYRDAANSWEEQINSGYKGVEKPMLKLAFIQAGYARKALDAYKLEKAEQANKSSKVTKKDKRSASQKQEDAATDQLNKDLKAIDDDFKAKKDQLDRDFRQQQKEIRSRVQ